MTKTEQINQALENLTRHEDLTDALTRGMEKTLGLRGQVLTKSQARLKDLKTTAQKNQHENAIVSRSLQVNKENLEKIRLLVTSQEAHVKELGNLIRSDLKAIHQLEMDGVFLPPEEEEDDNKE